LEAGKVREGNVGAGWGGWVALGLGDGDSLGLGDGDVADALKMCTIVGH
jgi:hypothetical protein